MEYYEYVIWGILTLGLISLSMNKKIAFACLLIACVGLVYCGVLSLVGIGILIGFAILLGIYLIFGYVWIEILLVLGCTGLFFHFIPGFHNPKVLDNVLISSQSVPYSMYFNLDKSLIPFILTCMIPTLFCTDECLKKTLSFPRILFLVCFLGMLLWVATFLKIIKPEFHVPSWIILFVWVNLFFVSYVEEAFFRGYFQQRFSLWIGRYPALILASLLFASYHLKIGYLLALFAFFAGIAYGLAWMWSGRVWVSTIFHFGLNLVHLLFFTYPLSRG